MAAEGVAEMTALYKGSALAVLVQTQVLVCGGVSRVLLLLRWIKCTNGHHLCTGVGQRRKMVAGHQAWSGGGAPADKHLYQNLLLLALRALLKEYSLFEIGPNATFFFSATRVLHSVFLVHL